MKARRRYETFSGTIPFGWPPDVLYVVSQTNGMVRALRLTDGATLWERDAKLVDGIWPVEKGLLVLRTPYDDASGQKGQTRLELWH